MVLLLILTVMLLGILLARVLRAVLIGAAGALIAVAVWFVWSPTTAWPVLRPVVRPAALSAAPPGAGSAPVCAVGDDVDAAEAGPDVSRGPVRCRARRRVCLVSSDVELVSLPTRLCAAR